MKILYDEKELDNFSIAQIQIRNIGNLSIKSVDVAPRSPIQISVADDTTEILGAEIISFKNDSNNLKVFLSNHHSLSLSFDFMDPKDDCCIQIYHTGTRADSLRVSGAIIGEYKPFEVPSSDILKSRLFSFQAAMIRLAIDPKLKWLRVLVDLVVGIGCLSCAFLTKPNVVLWLIAILAGVFSLYQGVLRMTKSKSELSEEKRRRLEHRMNVTSQKLSKRIGKLFDPIDQ